MSPNGCLKMQTLEEEELNYHINFLLILTSLIDFLYNLKSMKMDVSAYRNLLFDFFSCRIINIVKKDDKNNIDEIVNFTHIMEELLEWNNNTVDFISEKSFLIKLE